MSAPFNVLAVDKPSSSGKTWAGSNLSGGVWIVLSIALLGFLVAAAYISFLWVAVAALTIIPIVIFGCKILGTRPFATFALIYSLPFPLMYHFVYRQNNGAADGITFQLFDIWTIWLLVQYAFDLKNGKVKSVPSFWAIYAPLGLTLTADLLSFVNSSDIPLSIYGIVNHARGAAVLIALLLTLTQGAKEIRAASLGILCSVVTIGSICVGEMIFHRNIIQRPDQDLPDDIFRAEGLLTPTLAAAFLATLLPLVALEFFLPVNRRRKVLAGIALIVGFAGLGCTLTRAAMGILAFGCIPLFIFLVSQNIIRIKHIVFALALLVIFWATLADKIGDRLAEGSNNWDARIALTKTALNMAADAPLVGEGVNNYELKMYSYIPSDQRGRWTYVVHNKFLLTLAETGVVGFVALVWLLAVGIYRSYLLARRKSPLGVALFCSMIILILDMNVETYSDGSPLLNALMVIALIEALWLRQQVKTADGQVLSLTTNPLDKDLSLSTSPKSKL